MQEDKISERVREGMRVAGGGGGGSYEVFARLLEELGLMEMMGGGRGEGGEALEG